MLFVKSSIVTRVHLGRSKCFVSSLFLKLGSGCMTISLLYNLCMLQIILFRYSIFNFKKSKRTLLSVKRQRSLNI